MTIVLLIMVLILLGSNIYTGFALHKVRAVVANASVPALEAGDALPVTNERHKLERTFTDRRLSGHGNTGQDFIGWHYVCSCGTIAPANDNFGGNYQGEGSEQGAVKAFVNHRLLYATSVEAGENELARVTKEFEEYKKTCICHDL